MPPAGQHCLTARVLFDLLSGHKSSFGVELLVVLICDMQLGIGYSKVLEFMFLD